ncbi:MAG: serine protease [Boseongicola sp. SB0677_bin_26]|nr:serine protease [Boseongicola sp. SB0665_bin_10]MYG28526.1 serine protease [Boseongicola sp. SB0677_bin_26]
MPIWSEILNELSSTQANGNPPDFDGVRRKHLAGLYNHTKRNVILYASGWLQKSEVPPSLVSISDEDMQAFMEVTNGLQGDELDLIIHSPGGSPEAAEAIVSYLRARFNHVRVIVPQLAMSAATMISCAADILVLGKHSFLGPTDPQLVLPTSLGVRAVPAQAILDQFDLAKHECADPAKLSAWLPMLNQVGPDLIVQCESALEMSKDLVRTWLETYMFKDSDDRLARAQEISEWLSGHQNFKSHSRHIPRNEAEEHAMRITRLESDDIFQDAVLSVFHATTHTFSGTRAVKIVENHMGRAFIKQHSLPQMPSFQLDIGQAAPEGTVLEADLL